MSYTRKPSSTRLAIGILRKALYFGTEGAAVSGIFAPASAASTLQFFIRGGMVALLRIGLLVIACALLSHRSLAQNMIAIEPIGGQGEPLFNWSTQRCPDGLMIPDAPVRAFRTVDGGVRLFASHYVNWSFSGRNFESLKPSCHVVFGPADTGLDQHAWIEATYTLDGQNVVALLSRELSTNERPVNCHSTPAVSCWLSDIVAATSTNMGRHFTQGPIMATLGNVMPVGYSHRFGAFTTSNIVKGQDGYYTIVFMEGADKYRANCLVHTTNPMDPTSWRGWDGNTFAINLSQPAQAQKCMALSNLDQPVRSIGWMPAAKRWIAVFKTRAAASGKTTLVTGIFYSESPDLHRWTPPRPILEGAVAPRQMGWDRYWHYPVLIDPDSKSRNFDTLDHETAVLLFTEVHLKKTASGKLVGTMNRDLARVNVQLKLITRPVR